MTDWVARVLILIGFVGVLVLLYRAYVVVERQQATTKRLCEHQLVELDRRPEFDQASPDWPIRESPPPSRTLERR